MSYSKKATKLLSFLLCVVLVVAALPFATFASTTVTTKTPESIADTTATFVGTYKNSGSTTKKPKEVGFAYSIYSDDEDAEMIEASKVSESFSCKVTRLDANETYYVRAYAAVVGSNDKTTYTYGREVKFNTKSSSASTTGIVKTVSAEFDRGVIIAVGSVGSSYKNDIDECGFVYSSTDSKPTIRDDSVVSTLSNLKFEDSFYVDVTPSKYYVRAYVIDEDGKESYGATETVSTKGTTTGTTGIAKTVSVEYDNGVIYAEGSVGTSYKNQIDECGFVYSSTSTTPKIDDDDTIDARLSSTTFEEDFTVSSSKSKYYVRAYAILDNGTVGYGSVETINTDGSSTTSTSGVVKTVSAVIDRGVIFAEGSIGTSYKNEIDECGFVYSHTNTRPTTSDEVVEADLSSTKFEEDFSVDTSRTKYYVRAYAITEDNKTHYGDVKVITLTGSGKQPVLNDPSFSNVTDMSAEISYVISSNGESNVSQSGIVFSDTNDTPTIGKTNCYYELGKSVMGSNPVIQLSNLAPATTYYVRAFAENNSGIGYSKTKTFKTGDSGVKVVVNFESNTGLALGSQTFDTTLGATISVAELKIPDGYRLIDPLWSHTVSGSKEIFAFLTAKETEYYSGLSNFRFGPTDPATRAEIAQILYNLSADKTYAVTKTYADVPSNHPYKQAIDFVTFKGYMRGFEDKFTPDSHLTRAQFATTLYFFYKLDGAYVDTFSDCKDHWAKQYISQIAQKGFMRGPGNGTFLPDNDVTRAEVCITFGGAEKRTLQPLSTTAFTDVNQSTVGYQYIMNASIPRF